MAENTERKFLYADYSNFYLSEFKEDFAHYTDKEKKDIRTLFLPYNIDKFPEELFELTELENLYLNCNDSEFEDLPKEINKLKKLKNLKKLDFGDNGSLEIPETIGNLTNLEDLVWDYNSVEKIPASIGNLRNLEFLNLEKNRIKEIPESIGNLENLRELYLQDNDILGSLPNSIGNLKNLIKLSLNNNQITELPDSIGELKNLRKLHLDGNPITKLPEGLCKRWKDGLVYLDFSKLDYDRLCGQ
jgi:Leucine-rich repeat (LRR) protein